MSQEPEQAVYWVLPGERRLSPQVFGGPENPRFGTDLLRARIEQAKQFPSPLCRAIPQLLEDLSFLVAAPEEARAPVDDDSIAREKLAAPTLYSDNAQVTSGEDLLSTDLMGEEGATQSVTFTATTEMAEYYCQVHPETMRGPVDVQS